MKPTQKAKRWKGVKHCQRNATRHGAYSAHVFSARAFLRSLGSLLDRLEATVETPSGTLHPTNVKDHKQGNLPEQFLGSTVEALTDNAPKHQSTWKEAMWTTQLLFALVLASITTASSAQSFQDTSIAFRKFEAKTKAGVSYNKYVEALPDIEFATREFELVSGEANKKNAASFRDALEKYKQAGLAWEQYIKWVVGNGDTWEWQQFFVDKVRPHFCPGARTVVGVDVLMPCLSKNWNEAGELVASLREVKAEPPPAGKRRTK